MRTILIAGHDLKFLGPITHFLENLPDTDVLVDQWDGHANHDEERSMELLNQADVIFCEWGLGNAVWYSRNKRPGQRLIVRMHLQEKDSLFPRQFVVDQIDAIVTITPYWYEEFHRIFGFPRQKMKMIYNVLDTEALDLPKTEDAEFNLGMVGIVPQRKRIDRALDILEMLYHKDKRYRLFIKGKQPYEYEWMNTKSRSHELGYYKEQEMRIQKAPWRSNVVYESHGNDMPEWFRKIGWILSVSDFEGSHQAPSEGMAAGAVPVLINWAGAETVYPRRFIFPDTSSMARFISSHHELIGASSIQSHARRHFDKRVICDKYEQLLLMENGNLTAVRNETETSEHMAFC